MKISSIMSRQVATVTPRTTLLSVGRLMSRKRISCVVVEEKGRVIGIISERDLVRRLAENGGSVAGITAGRVMSAPVETLAADMDVERAVSLMAEKGFRRFPIVSQKGTLVGILTQSDALKAYMKEFETVHERVKDLSVRDFLTGLYNRRLLIAALEKEFYRSRRHDIAMTLIMVDLDDFKDVNDRYGHQHGDQVLRTVAQIIQRGVRSSDIAARFGGEEFVVLAPDTDADNALRLSERLRKAIAESGITASLGVARYPNNTSRFPEDLIQIADQAMYQAKTLGKNRVVLWTSRSKENKDAT
ncbi:MAG: GGDEF domain-containing protein [bacterium]|nr:MAG: GGDEF domain-containing protein [bacterium]